MKKVLKVFLLVAVLIMLVAGCSSGKKNVPQKEQFKENVQSSVDLSKYTEGNNKDDKNSSYSLKSDLHKDYDMDFVVSLEKTKITMPVAFSELEKQGWKIVNEKYYKFPLKPNTMGNTICSLKKKNVNVFSANTTDKNIFFPEGTVSRISVELFSAEDEFKKKLSTAPDFIICKDIDNKSSMNDVIETMGEPSKIERVKVNDKCSKLILHYMNISNYNNLKIEMTEDGKKIVRIDYNADVR